MSTFGIVALSLLAGLLLAFILFAFAFLIYTGIQIRKLIVEFKAFMLQSKTDMTANGQSLQSSFARIKESIQSLLETHRQEISVQVSKINGEGLFKASAAVVKSADRIEKAALAIGEIVLSQPRETELAPEEYADGEPGERFITSNPVAAQDQEVESEEGASVTTRS